MRGLDGPTTRMEVFTNATGVTNNNSHFSHIARDQVNYYYTNPTNARGRKGIRENLPQLEEFTEVKQGNIIKEKDICEPWLLYSSGETVETAVYTAKIIPFGNEKFTVKPYSGGGKARKKWRRDFLRCSNDWRRDIPLFGYSKSTVPLLIFHGELIPVAHIEKGLGNVGFLYTEFLRNTLGCLRNELWMDPTKGIFCRGPAGPKCKDRIGDFSGVIVPLDVEFLKKDIVIRYFISTQDDQGLFEALDFGGPLGFTKEVAYSQIISRLTNSTIAFYRNLRWRSWKGCLDPEELMSDGTTRFRLKDDQCFIEITSMTETYAWLSQALSFFHAHGIGLDEDLSIYELVYPYFKLTGPLQSSKNKQQRRQLWGPFYLFLLPSFPPTYFWSRNPLGQTPLSQDDCEYFGVPFKLSIKFDCYRESWSTEIYKNIRDYQIARGFDPITMDFARFRRVPIFNVVAPENRFQEVEEEDTKIEGSTNITGSLRIADDNLRTADSVSTQQGTVQSLLGALFAPFTFEAVEELDIPVVAI